MDTQSFLKKELKLDHDLHEGKGVQAASLLLKEFHKSPEEALALVKEEMARNRECPDRNKMHLSVQSNGDVIVWDRGERNGFYAGTIPDSMRPCPQQERVNAAPPEKSRQEPLPNAPVAPPESASPQSYEYEQPRHKGFHIPMPIDIGVKDGTFRFGVNILGLAKGGVMLGAKTRGYVGSDAMHSVVSAGVDFQKDHIGPAADWKVLGDVVTSGNARVGIMPQKDGLNLGGGADVSAFGKNLGAGGHGGVEIGQKFGPHADGYAVAGPAQVGANGEANLSAQGFKASGDADVGAQPYAGVHAGGRVGLGATNEAHADAGTNVGDNGVSAGAGIFPSFHPDVYGRVYSGDRRAGVGLIPARAWATDSSDSQP